ncbi:RNA-processing protein [Thermocladium modestius]|uniref:RNA-processing protein n=1 Tax=Thermocladium modestius TaxID=62609 RepID=A0A830GST5_9CREN|nr:KH domain-containing protein [Thermocladium modestius]GGP19952.1 RNA-processing protein [Thermocladium modestius]
MLSDYLKGGINVLVDEMPPQDLERVLAESHRVIIKRGDGFITLLPQEGATFDDVMISKRMVEAVAAGFSVDDALMLEDRDYLMDQVNILDYADKGKPSRMNQLRGLIIGENGKAKRNIEELTETKISVKSSMIYIIGRFENVEAARTAIDMLLAGRQHSTVYKWLQSWRAERQRSKFINEIDEEGYLR